MKKISSILFTDLHLNAVNKDICLKFIKDMCSFIIKKGRANISNISFLGDFIDNRKGIDQQTLTAAIEIFNILNNLDIPIYMIPGNHDKLIENGEESYLDIFNMFKNVHIYKKLSILKNVNFDFYYFPYFEGGLFEEGLKELTDIEDTEQQKILLSHYMYEQIPSEIKQKFQKVFLGHNHEREKFPNGIYLGACFQHDFCEDNQKGFTILYDDLSIEQIQFQSVEFFTQKVDINSFNEQQIKDYILDFKEKYPDKLLRIELNGYSKNISEIKEFCKQQNVSFISKVINNTENLGEEKLNIESFSKDKIKKQFEFFCIENNVEKNIKDKLLYLIEYGTTN